MRGKRLSVAVKRPVQMYSYGAFANRLVQTASFYLSRTVIWCPGAYTGKQCGSCGYINDKLGGAETFRCTRCSTSSAVTPLCLYVRVSVYRTKTSQKERSRFRNPCILNIIIMFCFTFVFHTPCVAPAMF
jgi:hypothetical protein